MALFEREKLLAANVLTRPVCEPIVTVELPVPIPRMPMVCVLFVVALPVRVRPPPEFIVTLAAELSRFTLAVVSSTVNRLALSVYPDEALIEPLPPLTVRLLLLTVVAPL